jgi:hypothetical protein
LTVDEISLPRNQTVAFRNSQFTKFQSNFESNVKIHWDSTRGENVYHLIRESLVASIESPLHSYLLDSMHKGFLTYKGKGNRAMEREASNLDAGKVDVIRNFLCFRGRPITTSSTFDPASSSADTSSAGVQTPNSIIFAHPGGRFEMEVSGIKGYRVLNECADVWNADSLILNGISEAGEFSGFQDLSSQHDPSSSSATRISHSFSASQERAKLRNPRVSKVHMEDFDFQHLLACNAISEWTVVPNDRKDKTRKQLDQSRNFTIDLRTAEEGDDLAFEFEIGGLKYLKPPKPVKLGSRHASVETVNPFDVLLASNLHVVSETLDTAQATQMFVNMTQQAEKQKHFSSLKSSIPSGLKMVASIADSVDFSTNARKASTDKKAIFANQKRAVDFRKAQADVYADCGRNIVKEYDDQHLLHSVVEFFAACSLRFMDLAGKVIAVLESATDDNLNNQSFSVEGENQSKIQNEVNCNRFCNSSLL